MAKKGDPLREWVSALEENGSILQTEKRLDKWFKPMGRHGRRRWWRKTEKKTYPKCVPIAKARR